MSLPPTGKVIELQQRCRENGVEWRVPIGENHKMDVLKHKLSERSMPSNGRLKTIQERC